MNASLTLQDLLRPGEPLDPAEVLAGREKLSNAVTWVVSLRPYPPALPRLRGGELALVAMEHLARLEPPITLAAVIRQLAARDAAGAAVRGDIDRPSVAVAEDVGLPLLQLAPGVPLPDIEQAVMRECALFQARREMMPAEAPTAWVDALLGGQLASVAEAQVVARRHGYGLAAEYAVAYVSPHGESGESAELACLDELESELRRQSRGTGAPQLVTHRDGEGLVVLLPPGTAELLEELATDCGLCCGVGQALPVLAAAESLSQARLAYAASRLLAGGAPVHYDRLGADRLLLILHRDRPAALRAFVEETLGPLLERDAESPSPLLPTLQAFIEHGGRLRETAEVLSVHRNTLAYRLDRAAEVLRMDLHEGSTQLALGMALRGLLLTGRPDQA